MPTRKVILITGASSGLGQGMAREFAKLGRDLALCARRVDRLEALRAELLAAHPHIRVAIRALDVNDHTAVFETFAAFDKELGGIDRVIVNAGMGKGASLGKGHPRANIQTAQTNFVSAMVQCEAALEIFRPRSAGHLVTIASVAGLRGAPRAMTVYAATKAGLLTLSEGIRVDLKRTPIRVTTILPGFIRSEINEKVKNTPFIIDTETGCRALVRAIEREPAQAYVPAWPWWLYGQIAKCLPWQWLDRLA